MVNRILMAAGMALIAFIVVTFSTLIYASEDDPVKFQGAIMAMDLKKNTMVVNERILVWDQNTAILNVKGNPITMDKVRLKSWVYVEGVGDIRDKIMIQKMHLLPKYVDKKEKHLYPFME